MMIDTKNWGTFVLNDILKIINGKGITSEEIDNNPGYLEAVQSGETNNGVIGFIDRSYCQKMEYVYCEQPCLTLARTGSAGFVSYHAKGCVVGDSAKILLLKNPVKDPQSAYLFLQTLLNANRFKYTYGRKVTVSLYEKTIIKLPINKYGTPDWDWIENYIKSLNLSEPRTHNSYKKEKLQTNKWNSFKLSELFNIKKGKRLTKEDQTEGTTPYIGAIDSNNGVSGLIGQSAIHEGETISLSYNGSVGEAFYQALPFWATDDVNVLYPKFQSTRNIALFICTLLRQEKYRFCYGRKWTLEMMLNSKIKLPVSENGTPDWDWIENYMKSLPYGDC